MPRKQNPSLSYFGMETDFDDDNRFNVAEEIILREGGTQYEVLGITKIATRLLGDVYASGYYVKYTKDLIFRVGRGLARYGIYSEKTHGIIIALIKAGYFNAYMFNTYGIITSAEIQLCWVRAMKALRRKATVDPKYDVSIVSSEEIGIPSALTAISSEETRSADTFLYYQIDSLNSQIDSLPDSQANAGKEKKSEEPTAEIYQPPSLIQPPAQQAPKEPPGCAAPPLNPESESSEDSPGADGDIHFDEIDLTVEYFPTELVQLYLKHPQFQDSRNAMRHEFGFADFSLFKRWLAQFEKWLVIGKGNAKKDMTDFATHLKHWFNTIDDLHHQKPEEYKSAVPRTRAAHAHAKPGSAQNKQFVPTKPQAAAPDYSRLNQGKMSEGF